MVGGCDSLLSEGGLSPSTWELVEPSELLASQDSLVLRLKFGEDSRFSADTGCNGVGGEFELGLDGRLKLAMGSLTLKLCPETDHLERTLLGRLDMVRRYRAESGFLRLSEDNFSAPLLVYKRVD